jgi:hypothetical protein
MNSYSTHNDVTALYFCCCRRQKQQEEEKPAGAPEAAGGFGIAERALNDPRNLTSTNHDTSKRTSKNHNTK